MASDVSDGVAAFGMRRPPPRPAPATGGSTPSNEVTAPKTGKMKEHSYMTQERVTRLANEAKKANALSPERNPSLLSPKYADPKNWLAVQAQAEAEIKAGHFTQDPGGGKKLTLDMHEHTGWSDGTPTTKLDVRLDAKGRWHYFPTLK